MDGGSRVRQRKVPAQSTRSPQQTPGPNVSVEDAPPSHPPPPPTPPTPLTFTRPERPDPPSLPPRSESIVRVPGGHPCRVVK